MATPTTKKIKKIVKITPPAVVSSLVSKVLLVQTDSILQSDLHDALVDNGFQVTAKTSIKDGLSCIAKEHFDALICDLHLPAAGDGFTLVNAMRHVHPNAITMVMSNYPALRESVAELLPQADEVLVSPIAHREIVKLLKARMNNPQHREVNTRASVATILERHSKETIKEWLKRVKKNLMFGRVKLDDVARTGHLPQLFNELIKRLRTPRVDEGKAKVSDAALAHGTIRRLQGYSAEMLVEESRVLQVCIFKTLRTNLNSVDLTLLLTDVMTIADEVDSQLTQTMACFTQKEAKPRAAVRVMAG